MHVHPSTAKSASSYPRFHPHITLATVPSTTPISTLISSIPHNQPKINAKFNALQTGNVYFRSVYIAISPAEPLSILHKQIHESLGINDPNTPAFPHMSVYYIDDSEPEERVRVAQELLTNGTITHDTANDGIVVDCSKGPTDGRDTLGGTEDLLTGFNGTEIWAALCNGPVETWTVEAKVSLF